MDIGSCYYSKMKNYFQLIKIAAACLLLLSFFLPMSSCSYTVPIDKKAGDPGTETRTSIMYAREYTNMDEVGGWLNILAFTWPILLIGLQWRFSDRKYSYLFTGSGVLLAVFSAVVVYTWADIGTPLLGAYVGGGAAGVLLMIYLVELFQYIRKERHSQI